MSVIPHFQNPGRSPSRRIAGISTLAILLVALTTAPADATTPPCSPCAGIRVEDPLAVATLLASDPRLDADSRLYVAWDVELSEPFDSSAANATSEAGGTPWLRLVFRTPVPLLDHLELLEAELAQTAIVARDSGPANHFQVIWEPEEEPSELNWAREYGFLLKRVAVTLTGEREDSRVITGPLAPKTGLITTLYGEDVAAYLDGVALSPGPPEELTAAVELLAAVDPGRPVVLDADPFPADRWSALATAAERTVDGLAVTFFDLPGATREQLAPLKLMAREFQGDITLDPYSVPTGASRAWSFVRGEDLGLRVVVEAPASSDEIVILFPDALLRSPARIDALSGEAIPLFGQRRTADGLEVRIADPAPITLMRLERMTAADLELEGVGGLEDALTITDQRQMPVEEILRRLQAFEDRQARRINHYQALNTTHLRFQLGTADQSAEVTFEGDFFFRRNEGFDWAWQRFFFNGVRWRHKSIPEIPLIQPEKAAAMPTEISFTREYSYRLRGTATIDDRDCWVVDFEPAIEVTEGRSLFQGTVWIDRQVYSRVRTRAVQLGLKGDVISSEETLHFSPIDADGNPAPWEPASYILPLRVVGQQIWSILSSTTVVERETEMAGVKINHVDFEHRRQEILASESTMVRETDAGLRYLVADAETGERFVEEELNMSRKFLGGGILHDETFDFPLPLAGINWLSLDWRGKGSQTNVFFAGILANAAFTNPAIGESKFDLGFDATALAIAFNDVSFSDGVEIPEENVKTLRPNIEFKLGHPLGSFVKLDLRYRLGYTDFSATGETAEEFVVPSDHLNHSVSLLTRYNRGGYRFQLQGSHTLRGEWEPWGLPDSDDYDPTHEEFSKWGASFGKVWHLPKFRKIGLELEYVDGVDLDRFSKYGFGLFSDIRVHGYQIDKVRAEEVMAAHLRYGFDLGTLMNLSLVGDAAWATDAASGLDKELLAGVGVAGTFAGPGRTLINLDVGMAVAGPDEGFSVFLVILKLFEQKHRKDP